MGLRGLIWVRRNYVLTHRLYRVTNARRVAVASGETNDAHLDGSLVH